MIETSSPHHDFFDAEFYQRQAGPGAGFDHFIEEGDAAGLDPSPYFATGFYKMRYPDWGDSGARTGLDDFLSRLDTGEGRQPHPLIDPEFYVAAYPDLAGLGVDAVPHFIRHGDAEGRRPSQEFDAEFYRRCYLPLGQGRPFHHYVTTGADIGHLPRPQDFTHACSARQAQELLAGLTRPVILALHDAQAAGVPILTLDLADAIAARGWQPIFLMLRAGPLLPRFRARGQVLILAEGWDAAGLAAGTPAHIPAIVNSAAAASLAEALAEGGRDCLLMVHEMADYLHAQELIAPMIAAQGAGARLIASMPRMADALAADLGPMPVIRPGLKLPPTSLDAFRRVRRLLAEGLGAGGPVFIGAGHADYRKGFDLFIAAAQRIAAERADSCFVWLGALDDWAQALASRAQDDGLNLLLPGFVEDAPAWYLAADVYLLTSRQDPGPTTVMHAARVGTPFVGYAADIGLIGLIEPCGTFITPGDEAGFATAALSAAASPRRRALRTQIDRLASFDTYADAVLSQLTHRQEDG